MYSSAGRRPNNEDCCDYLASTSCDSLIAILSDGMGGHLSGEVASKIAVQAGIEAFDRGDGFEQPEEQIRNIIVSSHNMIRDEACSDFHKTGMGATIVIVHLAGSRLTVGHVGDSRAIQFRDKRARRLTQDDLFVVTVLGLSENTAKQHPQGNVLTQALGMEDKIAPTITTFDLHGGDSIVLCSDGVSEFVDEPAMWSITRRFSPAESARKLVKSAMLAGSSDNCSAIVIRVP